MDLVSGFKSELFRPLAVLVVPGSFAISPFLLIVSLHHQGVIEFADANPVGVFCVLLILSTAAGMLLENIGSRIERGIDQCMVDRYLPEHENLWARYLEQRTDSELIAQRYLRTVVTRAKFVLSFLPSLVVFLCGFLVVNWQFRIWSTSCVVIVVLLILTLSWFLLVEAIRLSEVMAEVRCRVLAALDKSCSNPEKSWPGLRLFVAYVFLHVAGRHPEKVRKLMSRWYPQPS